MSVEVPRLARTPHPATAPEAVIAHRKADGNQTLGFCR